MEYKACATNRESYLTPVEQCPEQTYFVPKLSRIRCSKQGSRCCCLGRVEKCNNHHQRKAHADMYTAPHRDRHHLHQGNDHYPPQNLGPGLLNVPPPNGDGHRESHQGGHHNGGFKVREQPRGSSRLEGTLIR